ncbi:MAG: (Fe-S)-binding protein, partial [Anaerolineales bacterium]
RRHLVLMENAFPEELQSAYRGMERSANPWNVPPEKRMTWADGLQVPTVAEKPDSELLWWVGCAPSTDPRAQKSARSFAEILIHAGVDFAVLGTEERCTGDSARRSGNEYLFQELAVANVETLNRVNPRRIVTSCPHCLHTLLNEYPAFGGNYEVVHHTQLLEELIQSGKIVLDRNDGPASLTFHDPCYLGRQNNVYDAPRVVLQASDIQLHELPRSRRDSFCCGAGGAQIWKEEEAGDRRVSTERINEVIEAGENTLAVACPFCMIMLEDAAKSAPEMIEIRDVAEIVRNQIKSS